MAGAAAGRAGARFEPIEVSPLQLIGASCGERWHRQTDAKTRSRNFANVNTTDAADNAKLPTTNQTKDDGRDDE